MAATRTSHRGKKLRNGLLYPKSRRGKVSAFYVANLISILVFGLLMLMSASYATGYYRFDGDSYNYIRPQVCYAIAGLVLMYLISLVNYRHLRALALPLYGFTFFLLIVVLFMQPINNCRRWINVPGLPTLQVGEVAKFAIILLTAYLMELHRKRLQTLGYGILLPLAFLLPYLVLLRLEPHYSAIILISLILITMMACGGSGLRWFGVLGIIAIGGAFLLLTFQPDYISGRLEGWIPFSHDTSRMVYQTKQSIYTIGSGGLLGVGISKGRQKHLWLPESTNDFIFAVLCEELGFLGACLCIGLFVALILQGIRLAILAPDLFGSLLCIGVTAQVAWQTLLNIAVVTNTVPNTGISLPFFSSGGTSLLMLLCEMGVLLSVSREINREKAEREMQQLAQERNEENMMAVQAYLARQ